MTSAARTEEGTGDRDLDFAAFYEAERPGAVRLAALLTQNAAAGEDVAQEAFVQVYRAWDRAERPGAYLHTTIVNACNRWHRRRVGEQHRLTLLTSVESAHLGFDDLADAVAALPFKQRTVIVLRYYSDLSEAEIAEALGCRPGTVKSLASRALERLEKVIDR